MPWPFKKNITFEVVKPEDKAEEKAETPKEKIAAQAEDQEAQWMELQKLQSQWRKALEEAVAIGLPRTLKLQQDGETRFFYVLKDLSKDLGAEDQQTIFRLRCLRDDMTVYDVKTVVHTAPFSPILTTHEFQKVDPEKAGLNASEVLQLVKMVLKGEVPV